MKILKIIWQLPGLIYLNFISGLGGSLGYKLRFYYWRARLGALGNGSLIGQWVQFTDPGNIFLGKKCWIDHHVVILAGNMDDDGRLTYFKKNNYHSELRGKVIIGDETHIAPFCLLSGLGGLKIGDRTGVGSGSKLYSLSHHYRNLNDPEDINDYNFSPMTASQRQFLISAPVIIGDDCAVGVNSIILPGATIGNGTWISTASVIRSDVRENSIFLDNKTHSKTTHKKNS